MNIFFIKPNQIPFPKVLALFGQQIFFPDTFWKNIHYPSLKVYSLPAPQIISGQGCCIKMAALLAYFLTKFNLGCDWLRASLASHVTFLAWRYWPGAIK